MRHNQAFLPGQNSELGILVLQPELITTPEMSSVSNSRDGGSVRRNGRHSSGDEGDKSQLGSRPASVGFWDSELRAVRLEVFKKWGITTLILCAFIFVVLSLYWAVLFRDPNNTPCLKVWLVDFDSKLAPFTSTKPSVGPQIVSAGLAMNGLYPHLSLIPKPPSAFNNDPMAVRRDVYRQNAWAAIIINANATSLLQSAIATGNASFDPLGIAQVVYVEARDESTVGMYVTPVLTKFASDFTASFGRDWTARVLMNVVGNATALDKLRRAPQALSPGVGFSVFNLRPFGPPIATPSISIGLIYLIIISFFSFSFYLPIHHLFLSPSPTHTKTLHFYQIIIWRLLATLTAYFFLSFFYSVVSLAFQINFTAPPGSEDAVASPATAYGRASFVVYWVLNWIGMMALGLACENVAMVVGLPWAALWLIFWVISNVSTGFYNLDLAPRFYYWGYAWPLHNIVEASRTILFDTHSRIGLNFGVLLAWCVVNIALFPCCCYFMQWKTLRAKKKEAAGKGEVL